jgi:hypothetical protein
LAEVVVPSLESRPCQWHPDRPPGPQLDFPRISAPFMQRPGREIEMNKMIKLFSAPIEPADVKVIIDH